MKDLQQASIVQALADTLRNHGSWTGETHLQKSMYFLQELLSVPVGFQFVLYKHGPYSFDLNDTLALMRANGFIDWQAREPYGPSIIPGPVSDRLKRWFPKTPRKYDSQIDFVAEHLATRDVRELERLATALFVTRERKLSVRERVDRIHDLKPHISVAEAIAAVEEVDRLEKDAASMRLAGIEQTTQAVQGASY